MKNLKIFLALFFLIFLFQFVSAYDFKANCEERIFVVTAYYSPKS
jgi:hypothetical protein